MRKLAVIHHRHMDWVPVLKEAEPRLEIRGWHPREPDGFDWDWLRDAEALFTWKPPAGLVSRMPRLAWIQNGGAGVDHLVQHPEVGPGVLITRADGRFGLWMARYVACHLLMEAQRIQECRAFQAEGKWNPKLIPEDLSGKIALVVGFGRIGRQIGRALRELGLDVHGFVRTPRQDPEFPLHGTGELPLLLGVARVLVLCAPLTESTRGLVDGGLLEHGNPELTLVNVGRGEQVVVPDLLAALDQNRVGHAVLDVFPQEPLPADSPLWRHPKVTATPHHAGPSMPRAMIADMVDNLRAYAEGRPIEGAVDRGKGY